MKQLLISEFSSVAKPVVSVIPVGTITSVIAFLSRVGALVPGNVKCFSLLDRDAYDEFVLPLQNANNHAELAKIQRVERQIKYLPWTPEVGVCQHFMLDIRATERGIRDYFADARISLDGIDFNSLGPLTGAPQRRRAKVIFRELIAEVAHITQRSADRAKQDLSDYFAIKLMAGDAAGQIRGLLLPLLNA